jgi:hypothetical protein
MPPIILLAGYTACLLVLTKTLMHLLLRLRLSGQHTLLKHLPLLPGLLGRPLSLKLRLCLSLAWRRLRLHPHPGPKHRRCAWSCTAAHTRSHPVDHLLLTLHPGLSTSSHWWWTRHDLSDMLMYRIVLSLSLSSSLLLWWLLLPIPHLSTLSWVRHVPILLTRWTLRLVSAAHRLLSLLTTINRLWAGGFKQRATSVRFSPFGSGR